MNDEVLTPTFTADLAAQIRVLALEGPPGLYHATNQGSCSWYEFARAIFDLGGLATPLARRPPCKDFAAPVRRPFYSVLENAGARRRRPRSHAALARGARGLHGALGRARRRADLDAAGGRAPRARRAALRGDGARSGAGATPSDRP